MSWIFGQHAPHRPPAPPPPDPAVVAARTATITAIYQEELGRPPDPVGLAEYLLDCETGATAESIRANVRTSDEYEEHWLDRIRALYREVLHRPPTTDELIEALVRFDGQPIAVLSPTTFAALEADVRALAPTLDRLAIQDTAFLAAGAIWKWHGASDFRQFRHYLDGLDFSPLWAWARGLGVNIFRVFTMLDWADLFPEQYTDEQLRAYAVEVGAQGFRLELVGLADCAILKWSLADQQRHIARVADVVGDLPHVMLELANEPSHPTNRVDPLRFTKPTKGLWSRGSSHGDQLAIMPPWDYGTDHPPRDGEWPRKAKNLLEWSDMAGVPYVGDEPNKIVGARLTREDCADFSAVAELFAAGSTIHTQALGIEGQIPTGDEQARCEAWAESWRIVPPEAQLGTYTRGGFGNCPLIHSDATALRTFAMIHQGGREATAVVVRPTAAYHAVAAPGWRIVTQVGHVVRLTRG